MSVGGTLCCYSLPASGDFAALGPRTQTRSSLEHNLQPGDCLDCSAAGTPLASSSWQNAAAAGGGAMLCGALALRSYKRRRNCRARRSGAVIALRAAGGKQGEADRGFRILEWASAALGGQKTLVKTASWGLREVWRTMVKELAPQSPEGAYVRQPSGIKVREPVVPLDLGSGEGHAAYIGNSCPWCHRVNLAMTLRQVSSAGVQAVLLLDQPERASRGGWAFDASKGSSDPIFQAADLREVYDKCAAPSGASSYVGRCTAPLLVDKRTKRAVSNDNPQIVRMLNGSLGPGRQIDLVPAGLEQTIDDTNAWTYELISNGVYRAGFATEQGAFEQAARDVAVGLERAEAILQKSRFLCGDRVTEADVMLLPCALRFDVVYAYLFLRGSCGLWRDRPALKRWLQDCWSLPGVRDTIDIEACRESYYRTLFPLNPSRITPIAASSTASVDASQAPLAAQAAESLFHWRDGGDSKD
eukprot:TRINITY_DN38453_c0_g2_i1.p1 TRINITY_DN38453_c0_g2~~TRINITY_DN38453_c0_g2_i1.p1  ORF type:complete len:472 (-),score=72.87 TRINITY_DN38453_c0_g2_i1:8-1423(-)